MKRKRILCFIDSIGAGGAQRQLVGLAALFKNRDYNVKVIFYHPDYFYKDELEKNSVEYEYLQDSKNWVKRIYHVYRTINMYDPEWVIAYLDTPCNIACVCKLLRNSFKLLVSERNTSQKRTLKDFIKYILFYKSDVIVPNSYSQEDFIKKTYPQLSTKIQTVINFVDTEYFKYNLIRKRNKIPKIVVVASIWPPKNVLNLIEAVYILKQRGATFKIEWYGRTEKYYDYLQVCVSKMHEYKIENYIQLLDKTKNIREVYYHADYFCLPSFYEGTANVLCEALSCGLPIICSKVCDNPIYVKEGINGYLFNPHSSIDIANKILDILNINDDDYSAFCRKSRVFAEKMFAKERFISEYECLINK